MSIHIRQTSQGRRYDVRLRDEMGQPYKRTFTTKKSAERFAASELTDRARGMWVGPRAGKVTLAEYTAEWLACRPGLRPRTRELYEGYLSRHIIPPLGGVELVNLTPSMVRRWNADLSTRVGASTVAKSYRLLRTILGTALADELIVRNPCQVKGAGIERAAERPIATLDQVWALADAVEPRFRALVLTAALTGLRWGELAGLTRRRVDLLHGTVTVTESLVELSTGVSVGPPKSDAGRRIISLPPVLNPVLGDHLARWAAPGVDGLVFVGAKGAPLRRRNFRSKWIAATREVGVEELHFHDLRHTANTIAASTGASTRELMYRMGHASPAAALRYQHATTARDAAIAQAVSELASSASSAPSATVLALPAQ